MQSARNILFAIVISILPAYSVLAEGAFSMDDINASLQMEYQTQLVLQPNAKHKAPAKRVVFKQPVAVRQPQRKIAPPSHQPAKKMPAPDAEDLFQAATYGNVNLITRLLQQGISVNTANSERETALHMAVANGRYTAVIYLINHGANLHARTIKNWQPIHHAARFRKANIANYLMQKGASPHAITSDGLSAIDMARMVNDQQLLRIFRVK